MSTICLPPDKIDAFKKAVKDKTINIAELLDPKMTTEQRHAIFEPYFGKSTKAFNTTFEQKFILKNRILGIKNLFSKEMGIGKYSAERKAVAQKAIEEYKAKQQQQLFSPKENEAFLNDAVDKQMGLHIDQATAQKVFDLSKAVDEAKAAIPKDAPLGTTPEFINAKHEFNDYINSLNEKPAWKSIRGSLASMYKNLFIGIKTGVKTATLGAANSVLEAVTRRVGATKITGSISSATKIKGIMDNLKMFSKTGVNTFISTSSDDAVFGESKRGIIENFGHKDTNITGNKVAVGAAKIINATARGVRYFAIDILHKVPMLLTSSVNFVDGLDITATQLAKMDVAEKAGLDANAIFKDAMKVNPETDLGKIARARSQEDVFRVLNINNTPLSEATTNLQRGINKQIPTLGDYLIPMAKVPSSVIYNQLENFGGGLATGTINIMKGIGELHSLKAVGKESTTDGVKALMQVRDGVNTLIRTIGVVGTAAFITMNLTKKDFTTDTYGTSYVRMGDYWLSTDAFAGAGVAVAGMMLAKTGKNQSAFDYATGGWNSLGKAPIIDSLNSTVSQGKQGKLMSGLLDSYVNPILLKDIQKSIKEKTINPVLVGTLIRTVQQRNMEDKAAAEKAAASRRAKKMKH